MPSIENLTERDIEWIVVAVEAVAALPPGGFPEDIARHEEWKALAAKLRTQQDLVQKR